MGTNTGRLSRLHHGHPRHPGPETPGPRTLTHWGTFTLETSSSHLGSRNKKPLGLGGHKHIRRCRTSSWEGWDILLCSSHTAFLLVLKQGKSGPTPRPSGASGVTLLCSKTPLPGIFLQAPSLEQPPPPHREHSLGHFHPGYLFSETMC